MKQPANRQLALMIVPALWALMLLQGCKGTANYSAGVSLSLSSLSFPGFGDDGGAARRVNKIQGVHIVWRGRFAQRRKNAVSAPKVYAALVGPNTPLFTFRTMDYCIDVRSIAAGRSILKQHCPALMRAAIMMLLLILIV